MSEHKHGGDIYTNTYRLDFSTNLNPLGMPESVRAAACEGVRRSDCYPDVQCRELVRAIAQKERVPEEFVVCANGAAELIFSVVRALRPKKALLVSPGFAEYERALAAKDCEIVYYPLRAENGFLLGCDYLEYLQEDVELLFLCNPNNPTGVQIDRALLERILRVCKERGIRMVLDVCFLDFLDDPAQADFASQLKEYPQLFLLKAFTKTYAMAGLRLGYGLCADADLLEKIRRSEQPWNVSLPAQLAGAAALKEKAYVEKARKLVSEERRRQKERLTELGFTVYDGKANFLFFRGEPGLAQKCRDRGILIRDCSNYRGLAAGDYRIAVRTPEENEELIRLLAEITRQEQEKEARP